MAASELFLALLLTISAVFSVEMGPEAGGNGAAGGENFCTAVAIIPDDDTSILSRFKETTKEVTVAGRHTVTLEQDWKGQGVSGVLWDSAIVLVEYLVQIDAFKGKLVLELGAGLGLPSIIAASEGARRVIASEQSLAIPLLQRNIQLSGKPIEVLELDWNSPSACPDDFDLVMGADLVYREDVFVALRQTLERVTRPHTKVYMASKIRYPKDRRFYRELEESGQFKVERVKYDREMDVHVYKIVRV